MIEPTPRVLMVVSVDDAAAVSDTGPRKDYRVLADSLNAVTIDRSAVLKSRLPRKLVRWVGVPVLQAWLAFRQRHAYDVILTDGEHIGLPLALLLKLAGSTVAHVTIGHRLSAAKKRWLFTVLKLHSHINRIVLHSTRQYQLAIERLGIPAWRLVLLPYQVDGDFWQPAHSAEDRLICSAGLEFRDYPTLLEAVDGLDAEVVIGAASHWSKRRNRAHGAALPRNVKVSAFDYSTLRDIYARASIVVVPLEDVDFQAGITTILEAMAMAKPVVVTRTAGQTDVVEDPRGTVGRGEMGSCSTSMLRTFAAAVGARLEPTGFYVPPADPAALRGAIEFLLGHPEERSKLGLAGRRVIEQFMTVDKFAARVRHVVEGALEHQFDRTDCAGR